MGTVAAVMVSASEASVTNNVDKGRLVKSLSMDLTPPPKRKKALLIRKWDVCDELISKI